MRIEKAQPFFMDVPIAPRARDITQALEHELATMRKRAACCCVKTELLAAWRRQKRHAVRGNKRTCQHRAGILLNAHKSPVSPAAHCARRAAPVYVFIRRKDT